MTINFVFFTVGGVFALLIHRLVYSRNNNSLVTISNESKQNEINTIRYFEVKNEVFISQCSSRNYFLPNEFKLQYRVLKNAFGSDYVLVPKVKLSRVVNAKSLSTDSLKFLKTTGVDFVICAASSYKIIGVINYSNNNIVSEILKNAKLIEINLQSDKQYSVEELRDIFQSKILPSEARILKIAV